MSRNGSVVQQIRSSLFSGLWALWTAAFAPVILVIWICGTPVTWVRRATRVWARGFLVVLNWVVGIDYVVRGRENLPSEPCLIVANHQSTWETIACLVLFPDVAIVTKKELVKLPVFGWFLRNSPMIIIDRESGSKAIRQMVEEGTAALAQGRPVLIFPEGTRSDPSARVEFKRGVELLYARLNCAVMPVALNTGRYWGTGNKVKSPGTIIVSCLPAIPAGMPPQAAMKQAEQMIQAELDAM